jgi:glycosyltransferase involved in cell wall biosynthesis
MPTVSVIIPTYNRRAYVQEAIDSVLAQTYTDYEIIVIDDGSIDGTGEALRERYGDRIHYEWQENGGSASARNHGLRCSAGRYVQFLDSDDLILPAKLQQQVARLDANPELDVLYCSFRYFTDVSCDLFAPDWFRHVSEDPLRELIAGSAFPLHAVLARRSALDKEGGFCEALVSAEDWDLWLRLAFAGARFESTADLLALYRRHPDAKTTRRARWRHAHVQVMYRMRECMSPAQLEQTQWSRHAALNILRRALALYVEGQGSYGRDALCQAARLDPLLARVPELPSLIVEHAIARSRARGKADDKSVAEGSDLIRAVVSALPGSAANKRAFSGAVAAAYWRAQALLGHGDGHRTRVLSSAVRAVYYRPAACMDRSLISVSGQALLGARAWRLVRAVLRPRRSGTAARKAQSLLEERGR